MFQNSSSKVILFLRKFSISKRLYLLIVIFAVVSISITLFSFYNERTQTLKNSISNREYILDQTAKNIDLEFSQIILSISAVTTGSDVIKRTSSYDEESAREQINTQNYFKSSLNTLSLTNRSYSGGEIWSSTQPIVYVMTPIASGDHGDISLANATLNSNTYIQYFSPRTLINTNTRSDLKYLIIGKKIPRINSTKASGCALFAYSEPALYNSIFSKSSSNSTTYIVSSNGTIIFHPDINRVSGLQDSSITQWINNSKSNGSSHDSAVLNISNTRMLCLYTDLDTFDWNLVQVMDYSALLSTTYTAFLSFYITIAICIIILLLILIPITRSIISPLNRLQSEIDLQTLNNLETTADGNDEITSLADTINSQSVRIHMLMDQTLKAAEEKRIVQFQVLQNQINPHFLYNTLDAVNWMAYMTDNDDICSIITNLSDFFRLSLNKGNDYYLVSDEIAHVKSYIDIMRHRIEEGIQFHFEIDEGCMNCYTLKIILQPLVENAIEHGFDRGSHSGNVWIKCHKNENELIYEVENDGKDLDTNIAEGIFTKRKSGYGISNINDRIKVYFGENYGLMISPRIEGGVIARINIPLMSTMPEKEETQYDHITS